MEIIKFEWHLINNYDLLIYEYRSSYSPTSHFNFFLTRQFLPQVSLDWNPVLTNDFLHRILDCLLYLGKIRMFSGNDRSCDDENNAKNRLLRVVQRGIHFTFEINLGERRIRHSPTRKLNDVIFNQF